MFKFISGFFKDRDIDYGSQTQIIRPVASQSNQSISFDGNLIPNLKSDHVRLVTIYGRMWEEGYSKGNFEKLTELLAGFKYEFQTHIMKENVKFYVYLEQNMKDAHTLAMIREFRNDMNDIANAVVRFCKSYQVPFFTAELKHKFEKDYAKVGEVLTTRVTLEERDLYSLYSR